MVIGLLEEVMFSNVIGVRALIYFLLGYWIGKNNYSFSRADIRTGMIFYSSGYSDKLPSHR